MGRPKKATVARRKNGARATNKGKPQKNKKVPVLTCKDNRAGGIDIFTEYKPPLPKGYVAYEDELTTYEQCILDGGKVLDEGPQDKSLPAHVRYRARCQKVNDAAKKALKMAADSKGSGIAAKIAKLKTLTKGSTSFVFKDAPAEQPHGRRGRGARAGTR